MQGFIFERGPTIFKVFKEHNLYRLCILKCTEKRFIPFPPLHFLHEFFPQTEFKGRPEEPSGMYSTIQLLELCGYHPSKVQVPSILSILLG
jgi:hypothetical protein